MQKFRRTPVTLCALAILGSMAVLSNTTPTFAATAETKPIDGAMFHGVFAKDFPPRSWRSRAVATP